MADEILRGGEAIARALGLPRRSVYHHAAVGRLPTFKLGATVCARRSAVTAWLARCEGTEAATPAAPATVAGSRAAGRAVEDNYFRRYPFSEEI